jgi:hypothetical protein
MNKWTGVGPIEVALIRHLLFDAGILDVNWLVRDDVLATKEKHRKFISLSDEEYFTLVKRAASELLLEQWIKRSSEMAQVRILWIFLCLCVDVFVF